MPLYNDRLRERRLQQGYTQADLARLAKTNQQAIARWEKEPSEASGDAVGRLAKVLDCTTDWLLGLVEKPNDRLMPQQLSPDEQQLLNLYRQGKLPEMISRLVAELARPNAQKDLVVDSGDETVIPGDETTPGS